MGDYPYLNTFNSEDPNGVVVRSDYPDVEIPKAPTPVSQEKFSNVFPERFLNIHVDFKITNVTAEFPLVSCLMLYNMFVICAVIHTL